MPDEDNSEKITDLLPEGYISIGFIASIKALRPDGEVTLLHVTRGGLNPWEQIGMATSLQDDLRDDLRVDREPLDD